MYKNIIKNNKHIIIFDGICKFCSASIIFIYKRDKYSKIKFTTAQSPAGEYLLQSYDTPLDYNKSIVYIENGLPHTKSNAVLRIASTLPWPWRLLSIFIIIPKFIRDSCYDIIANNRYKIMGKRKTCTIPTDDFINRFI